MKKYFFAASVIVLIFITALPLSAASLLEKDMAAFDKAYITAMISTSQGKRATSKKAMERTMVEWASFKKTHADDLIKSNADKADLIIINQMLSDAKRIVRANGSLNEAHIILEGVRDVFLNIRKRNSIDYYIDYITGFHKPMNAIVLTARGKTPETLTESMLSRIKYNFKLAWQSWENLQKASFDPELFSFDAKKEAQRQACIKAETEALNKLKKVLNEGDKEEIIKAAVGIKPNFDSLFLLFSNFENVR
ncbi:MAG: hypothetical protein HGA29_06575 [Syntrophaceae bacterium]|nr:hypothetical protein [Syntrophaceae bacterium]